MTSIQSLKILAPIMLFGMVLTGCETSVGQKISAATAAVAFPVSVAIDRQTIDGPVQVASSSCEQLGGGMLDSNAISEIAIDIDSDQDMAGRGEVSHLKSLTLTNITLDIVDEAAGDTDNFDFIESIAFYSRGDSGDVLLAKLDPIPKGSKQIVAAGTAQNIKAMAASESFTIVTKAKGRLPCDDVHFTGAANFIAKPF